MLHKLTSLILLVSVFGVGVFLFKRFKTAQPPAESDNEFSDEKMDVATALGESVAVVLHGGSKDGMPLLQALVGILEKKGQGYAVRMKNSGQTFALPENWLTRLKPNKFPDLFTGAKYIVGVPKDEAEKRGLLLDNLPSREIELVVEDK